MRELIRALQDGRGRSDVYVLDAAVEMLRVMGTTGLGSSATCVKVTVTHSTTRLGMWLRYFRLSRRKWIMLFLLFFALHNFALG
ncbi:hypothetical protein DRN63_03455 [Nanoarchaeota archaeon]|nr:MAG: hypothetical protein DRN63_03455 [Nanoarchaeota archaeon]